MLQSNSMHKTSPSDYPAVVPVVSPHLFDVVGKVVEQRRRLRRAREEERAVRAALGVELGVLLPGEHLRRQGTIQN